MKRPNLPDKCDSCRHEFRAHYETYGGGIRGCTVDDQREGACRCQGFAIIYHYGVERKSSPDVVGGFDDYQRDQGTRAEDYYNK